MDGAGKYSQAATGPRSKATEELRQPLFTFDSLFETGDQPRFELVDVADTGVFVPKWRGEPVWRGCRYVLWGLCCMCCLTIVVAVLFASSASDMIFSKQDQFSALASEERVRLGTPVPFAPPSPPKPPPNPPPPPRPPPSPFPPPPPRPPPSIPAAAAVAKSASARPRAALASVAVAATAADAAAQTAARRRRRPLAAAALAAAAARAKHSSRLQIYSRGGGSRVRNRPRLDDTRGIAPDGDIKCRSKRRTHGHGRIRNDRKSTTKTTTGACLQLRYPLQLQLCLGDNKSRTIPCDHHCRAHRPRSNSQCHPGRDRRHQHGHR